MKIVKVARGTVNGARRTYKKGAKFARNTVNRVMKPTTKLAKSVLNKVPVFGGPLSVMASVPRHVTRGASHMLIAIPNAAAHVASTGGTVIKRAMLDPLLASKLLDSGLLASGRVGRKAIRDKRPKARVVKPRARGVKRR